MNRNLKKLLFVAIALIGIYAIVWFGVNAAFRHSFTQYTIDDDPRLSSSDVTCIVDAASSVFNTLDKIGFIVNGKFTLTDKSVSQMMAIAMKCDLMFR